MKKIALIISFFLMTISVFSQTKEITPKFNFDFEKIENGFPAGWSKNNYLNYSVTSDSINVKKGKYSTLIQFYDGQPDWETIKLELPHNYEGKKITVSCYMKTENVSEGYAGLWMRIDPMIGYTSMKDNNIKGTTDWTKYEITLDMDPSKTEKIVFGGLLIGKGKVWFDDLAVTIDGINIEDVNPIVFPAEQDKEFDNGSQITNLSLDKNKIQNLKDLGLVWGFIKYYHPNIAKGDYNWDYELFRVMPKVLNVKNKKQRDAVLVDWINQFGQFEVPNDADTTLVDIKMKPDLDWITSSKFSNELTSLLTKVKNAKRTGEHYYVSLFPIVGNPNFKNENPYASMQFPDDGYRILALYRYWNIIQYYFPYKYLIEEDWKNVLEEFIPKMINTTNETEYTLAVLELIARIHDTHANVWGGNKILNKYKGLNFTAADLTFIQDKAVVTYFYDDKLGAETGLEIGDIITKINNYPVETIVKDNLKYTPTSNYPTQLRDIAKILLRSNDSIISIEFNRNGIIANKVIKTYSTKEINIYSKYQIPRTPYKLINSNIAYIDHGVLKSKELNENWKEIQNTKGLIIDNRNYPESSLVDQLGSYLYPKRTPFIKFTKGSITAPGLFTFSNTESIGQENNDFYKGKIVILVNENTQSASEYHSMAYNQSPNAIVMGSTTAAADGNVSQIFYLPGNIITYFTGIGVYYPDGRETQRVGIVPNIEVKPTIEGVKNGRDEVLEKAINIINEQ